MLRHIRRLSNGFQDFQISEPVYETFFFQPLCDTLVASQSLAAEAAGGGPQHLHGASTLLLTCE